MRDLILLSLLLIAGAIFAVLSPHFLSLDNLLNMTRYFVEIGLISLPMTLIIISGGIDLAVGSTTALCAVGIGALWLAGVPLPIACALSLVAGGVLGAVNGAAITIARIPPLIVTLATLAFYRGLATGISRGQAIRGFPDAFLTIGNGELFSIGPAGGAGIPAQLPVFALCAVLFSIALSRTVFGRKVYALGANEEAARLSGIPVDRLKFLLYSLSGAMCGVAAIILVSRTTRAKAEGSAEGYELDAIAAVVLGGTNIMGGEGSVTGTVLGLLMISALRRGLMLMGSSFPSEVQSVIIGFVLILAVWMDQWLRPFLMRRKDSLARS